MGHCQDRPGVVARHSCRDCDASFPAYYQVMRNPVQRKSKVPVRKCQNPGRVAPCGPGYPGITRAVHPATTCPEDDKGRLHEPGPASAPFSG